MVDKEIFVLTIFFIFSIGFIVGWFASKIQDVKKEIAVFSIQLV